MNRYTIIITAILTIVGLAIIAGWPVRAMASYQCEAHGRLCMFVQIEDGGQAVKTAANQGGLSSFAAAPSWGSPYTEILVKKSETTLLILRGKNIAGNGGQGCR